MNYWKKSWEWKYQNEKDGVVCFLPVKVVSNPPNRVLLGCANTCGESWSLNLHFGRSLHFTFLKIRKIELSKFENTQLLKMANLKIGPVNWVSCLHAWAVPSLLLQVIPCNPTFTTYIMDISWPLVFHYFRIANSEFSKFQFSGIFKFETKRLKLATGVNKLVFLKQPTTGA